MINRLQRLPTCLTVYLSHSLRHSQSRRGTSSAQMVVALIYRAGFVQARRR